MINTYTNKNFFIQSPIINILKDNLNEYVAKLRYSIRRVFGLYGYRTGLIVTGAFVLISLIIIKSKTSYDFYVNPMLLMYTIFITSFEISRLMGAMMFKRSLSRIIEIGNEINPDFEPKVSFVIPCKNEEKTIATTIQKCYEADYPKNKIEVVIINDGSTDKTLDELMKCKKKFKNLKIVNWKINRGKRHGMNIGFCKSSGEIIIQLDSDSYIEPNSVRKLIEPFKNPSIGAVCAHADPLNSDVNLLTKMQTAYYFMSFRILKAAESTFMTVFCCSGCSSAYRKSVVMPIIDTWLNEKFMGLPVTWGDDRALTNWVLKQGYKTIYTDEAKAFTICPESWKVFFKQQVRWKKGWFVNSIFASKFILKKEPFAALTYFFPLVILTILTPFMAVKALVYNPLFRNVMPLYYMIGVFGIACLITIYYRYVARQNKYWPYIFVWSAINMIFLSFILFYALARLKDRRWGTR
jgi:hyaluronan synthase